MSDRFHPLSMEQLTDWVFTELEEKDSLFGIPRSAFFVPREDDRFRAALHLAAEHGVGPATADLLLSLPVIGRRFFESAVDPGQTIRSPADTEGFLLSRLGQLGHERFCCLYLDNRHRVLKFDELFRGTIDGTSVYPREVVKEALEVNAAAIIIAHNHPSGVAEPSSADERITQRLKAALDLVDIRLLDHLIIGAGHSVSLAGRGLL